MLFHLGIEFHSFVPYPVTSLDFAIKGQTSIAAAAVTTIIINSVAWSSDRDSWLLIHKSRVRFPALKDFLELDPLSLMKIT
jgi:hypothetical protein